MTGSTAGDASNEVSRLQLRLRALSEAMRTFAELTTDYEALLQAVAQKLAEILGDSCSVFSLSDDGEELVPLAVEAIPASARETIRAQFASFPMTLAGYPVARQALQSGEPMVVKVEPLADQPATGPSYAEFRRSLGIHSLLIVPLRTHGRSFGALSLARFTPGSAPYDQDDCDVAQTLASHAAIALSNSRLLRSERSLAESNARFAALSRSTTVGIVLANVDGVLHDANDAFLKMVGYSREDLLAGRIRGATLTPPEWRAADARSRELLTTRGMAPAWEKEFFRKDGSRIPIQITVSGLDARNHVCVITDLTDMKSAERELVGSQARLQALSDAGIIGIVVVTLEGRVLEINDTLLRALGYSREEITSGAVPWSSLTPAEWKEVDTRAVEQLRSGGIAALREKEYLRRDGTRVPALVGSTPLKGSEETISFVLDLTENKQAALAISHLRETRASEARFRALLEAAPDGMVIADQQGRIALVNRQAEQLFGYTRSELLEMSVDALVPERFRRAHAGQRQAYGTAPRARDMGAARTLVGRRKDGSEFPVEISLSPLETETGRLVLSAIRDVTERKRMDEQRSRLAALVDASDDAIIGKTLDGIITSWNAGASGIFGFSAEEAVGQPIGLLVPPDREQEEIQILEQLRRGERARFDTVRRRKDGREIHVSVTSSPVRDASGALIGVSKVARDITDRRQAADALAKAKEAAEAANRELEAFSYSVAHDLRAPLRGMNGFAHLLVDGYQEKLDAEGKDWLQEILLNANKMGALIDALLSLARVTRSEPRYERVDLSALAHSVAEQVRAGQPRQAEWVIATNLRADVDSALARALLDNLFRNAWKFTAGCPCPRIELGEGETPHGRAFFVRDNGAGFDMAYANKLFAPFQRLHSAKEFPGTGIGLATVQRIVHRHGGRVWAEGAVGRGATFYFSFPERASESGP